MKKSIAWPRACWRPLAFPTGSRIGWPTSALSQLYGIGAPLAFRVVANVVVCDQPFGKTSPRLWPRKPADESQDYLNLSTGVQPDGGKPLKMVSRALRRPRESVLSGQFG